MPGNRPLPSTAARVAAWAAAWLFAVALLAGFGSPAGALVGLPSVLLALAAAAWLLAGFWLSAWGIGHVLRAGSPATTLALGAAAVLIAGWLVAWALGIHRPIVLAVLAPGWALAGHAAWKRREKVRPERRRAGLGPLLLVPGLALLAVAASIPPGGIWRVEAFGYDTLSYHLQIPREWLAAGGMVELQHSVYAFLPGLMENAFALAMAAMGIDPLAGPTSADRVAHAAVPLQWFHASFAAVAALCVREAVDRRGLGGWAAAGLFLAVPWVVVTGSSAYNEMAALCFGAAALGMVSAERGGRRALPPWGQGACVGLLLGAACLAKPTAGFLLALPLGGWMLARVLLDPRTRLGPSPRTATGFVRKRRRSAALGAVAIAAVVGFSVLCPWFVRNGLWTGNPVFPFAPGVFGAGHWDAERVAGWATAHGPSVDASRFDLWRQWLGNRGFGALGGVAATATPTEIAVFAREGGVPVLWLLAGAGAAVGLAARRTRGLAVGFVALLLFQLAAWWLLTHHQSRFLVFTALPGAAAAGLLVRAVAPRGGRVAWCVAVPAVGVIAAVAASVLWAQTRRLPDPQTGEPVPAAPWMLMDLLAAPGLDGLDTHPLDGLPPGARVLVVGDNGGLLYADVAIAYASAFDESPMAGLMEHSAGNPQALAAALRARGFTHVWIGWSELARLNATYGLDSRLQPEALLAVTRRWPGKRTNTHALLAVPPPPVGPLR